jgi:hypothetical protein
MKWGRGRRAFLILNLLRMQAKHTAEMQSLTEEKQALAKIVAELQLSKSLAAAAAAEASASAPALPQKSKKNKKSRVAPPSSDSSSSSSSSTSGSSDTSSSSSSDEDEEKSDSTQHRHRHKHKKGAKKHRKHGGKTSRRVPSNNPRYNDLAAASSRMNDDEFLSRARAFLYEHGGLFLWADGRRPFQDTS